MKSDPGNPREGGNDDGSTLPTLVCPGKIVKFDLHYPQEAYLALFMR
jgi:hypothetical protein